MTAPENPPPEGGRASRRRPAATALLWVATLGLYWPVWLWRTYRALRQTGAETTRLSPRRAAGLAVIPGVNLLWTALLSVDLPRAVRRARSREAAGAVPDTELLTILLLTPVAAGVALAIALGLSPVLAVLLAGYLAWPFELPAAIVTERALGDLQPEWKPHERRRDVVGAIAAGTAIVSAAVIVVITSGNEASQPATPPQQRSVSDVSDIAVTRDALWVTNTTRGTLLKLDPATHEPVAPPIKIGRQPIDVGAREDGVWVANYESGTVVRVDPAANQLTGPIATGDGPFGIAVTPAAVWVTNQVDRTVAQSTREPTSAPAARCASGAGRVASRSERGRCGWRPARARACPASICRRAPGVLARSGWGGSAMTSPWRADPFGRRIHTSRP